MTDLDPAVGSLSSQPDRAGGPRARAALLEVDRYDIDVDLRGLLEGERWVATSTITFQLPQARARHVRRHRRRGRSRPPSTASTSTCRRHADGRLPLPGPRRRERPGRLLRPDRHRQRATRSCAPSTPRTSSSTSGPRSSRTTPGAPGPASTSPTSRPCTASRSARPRDWTVISNCAPDVVLDRDDGGRLWIFADTPRLSTYVVVVNAGPFHELRERARRPRPGPLLPAVAASSTSSGTPRSCSTSPSRGWRSSASGSASRSRRSATTRSSCPTWAARWRTGAASPGPTACCTAARRPTASAQLVAAVLLHEMAHMWFGDLVTMRWWDDLWLNEAFASWASTWAAGRRDRVHRRLGDLPRRRADRRLPAGHGRRPPTRSAATSRRGAGDGELRRDHLRQGRRRSSSS